MSIRLTQFYKLVDTMFVCRSQCVAIVSSLGIFSQSATGVVVRLYRIIQ